MPKKILIVENNPKEWEYMREIFILRGDEPIWIKKELEALQIFGEEEFDLV